MFVAALMLIAVNGIDLLSYLLGFATGQAVPDDSFMYIPPYMAKDGVPIFADDLQTAYFRFAPRPPRL